MPAPQLREILVPHVIRLKNGALGRLGLYLERENFQRVLLLQSGGLPLDLSSLLNGFTVHREDVTDNSLEWLEERLEGWDGCFDVVVGLGGGKALDTAKVASYRLNLPYFSVPTSLSNDGFCSPFGSLTSGGRRVTVPARLPIAVVVDLEIVSRAPEVLWLSGVGDLVSKWTAIPDWKLAFHRRGEPFDDLAALLSDGTVFQFVAHPHRDVKGTRLLAQALLFNGVAMEVAGSSRPASGSEHLISHALDQISASPRLHGLQVGLATYWMALVQEQDVAALEGLFETTGFWRHWEADPMPRAEWLEALRLAPRIKERFLTVLDDAEKVQLAEKLLHVNPRLVRCLEGP